MRKILLLSSALIPMILSAQLLEEGNKAGTISLGGRSAFSLFTDGSWNDFGTGVGGQFRIQLGDRVNTDWFLDYLRGNIGDLANRTDLHIGWSVLFYVMDPGTERRLLQPYVLAGHCFDHSRQEANDDPSNSVQRWSSAVQVGLGTHINLTDRFDISPVAQYMIHLGTDVHAEVEEGEVAFHRSHGANLEGHLLFSVSFNFKILDAW